MSHRILPVVLALLVLAMGTAALVACQPAPPSQTVRIGTANFDEQVILGEVYAQTLERAGLTVERRFGLGPRDLVMAGLRAGEVDLAPEYLSSLLAFVTNGQATGEAGARATWDTVRTALTPLGLQPLDYAPAQNRNAFAVTRQTADRLRLRSLSDLRPVASQMVLGGPPECPERSLCGAGLRDVYDLQFALFLPTDAGGPRTYEALQRGAVDVALVFSSDPRVEENGLVLLDDDRQLQRAENVTPVVRSEVLARDARLARQLNVLSQVLTTQELVRLNRQVSLEGRPVAETVKAWLALQDLGG